MHAETSAGPGAGRELAVQHGHSLAHPRRPVPGAGNAAGGEVGRRAATVVGHVNVELVAEGEGDRSRGCLAPSALPAPRMATASTISASARCAGTTDRRPLAVSSGRRAPSRGTDCVTRPASILRQSFIAFALPPCSLPVASRAGMRPCMGLSGCSRLQSDSVGCGRTWPETTGNESLELYHRTGISGNRPGRTGPARPRCQATRHPPATQRSWLNRRPEPEHRTPVLYAQDDGVSGSADAP